LERINLNTKIMATAGPTMEEVEQIGKAIQAGATHFRINMGLRQRDLHKYFRNIRLAARRKGQEVKVMLDMPTSRPRIGKMQPMELSTGDSVFLVSKKEASSYETRTIPLEGLSKIIPCLEVGHRILFRDGKVAFIVKKILNANSVLVECTKATTVLRSLGSSTFPDSNVTYQPIVSEDLVYFEKFAADDLVPDLISLSFASEMKQVQALREVVHSYWKKHNVNIIAKIETKQGLKNFDDILHAADGVMVARGDLLLNVPAYKLPKIQEIIVQKTNSAGKTSIVATEMFEQFAVNGVVNRAELSDIALAVRQKADIIMLPRETGNSNYPIETIDLICKLIQEEQSTNVSF
jgi:pyruvate kinase